MSSWQPSFNDNSNTIIESDTDDGIPKKIKKKPDEKASRLVKENVFLVPTFFFIIIEGR